MMVGPLDKVRVGRFSSNNEMPKRIIKSTTSSKSLENPQGFKPEWARSIADQNNNKAVGRYFFMKAWKQDIPKLFITSFFIQIFFA